MSQTSQIEQRLAKTISDIKLITNDIRTIFKRLDSITTAEVDTRRVVDEKFKVLLSKINFNNLGDLITAASNVIESIRSNIYLLKSLDPVDNAEHIAVVTSQITGDASETYTKTINAPTYTRDVWTDKERVGDDNPDFQIGDTINNVTVYTGSSPEDAFEYYTYNGEAMAKNAEGTEYMKGGSGELKGIELDLPASIKNSQILLNPSFDTSTDPKTLDTSKQIDGFINEDGIYLGKISDGSYEWKTDTEGNKTILKMSDGHNAPLYISPIDGIGVNYNSTSDTYTTVVDADGLHTNNVNIATDASADPYAGLNAEGTFVKTLSVNEGTTHIDENGNVITNNLYIGENVYDSEDGSFKPENALVSITDGDMKASAVKSQEDNPVFNIDANGIIINKSDGSVTIGDKNVLNANGTVVCEYIGVKNGDDTTIIIAGNAGVMTAETCVNVTDMHSNTIFQLNNTDGILVNPQGDNKVSINKTKVDAGGNVWTGKITNNKSDDNEFTIDNSSITSAKITVGDADSQSIIGVENDSGKITASQVKVGNTVVVNNSGITTENGKPLIIDGTKITNDGINTGSITNSDVYIGPINDDHNSNIEANEVICGDITTINNNGIVVEDPKTTSPFNINLKCCDTSISKSGITTNAITCGYGDAEPYSYIGPIEGTHTSNIETNDLYINDVFDITYNGISIRGGTITINENTEITTGSVSTTQINGIGISNSNPQITHTLYINEAHSQEGTGIIIDTNGITIQEETTVNTNTIINNDTISTLKISTTNNNAYIKSNEIYANSYVQIGNHMKIEDGNISTVGNAEDGTTKTLTVNGVTLNDINESNIHTYTIETNEVSNHDAYIDSNNITADTIIIGTTQISSGNITLDSEATVGGTTIKSNEIDANSLTHGDTYIGPKTVNDTEVQVLESPKLTVGNTVGNTAVLDENGITLEPNSTVTLGNNNITIGNTGIVTNGLTFKTDGTTTGPGLTLPVLADVGGRNVFMYLLDSANNKYPVYLDISDITQDPVLRVSGWTSEP